jgi:hypothetical protein
MNLKVVTAPTEFPLECLQQVFVRMGDIKLFVALCLVSADIVIRVVTDDNSTHLVCLS